MGGSSERASTLVGDQTFANFRYTAHMAEGDPLLAFRAELIRHREMEELTIAEAARRTRRTGRGISAQRWGQIEAGYEVKTGGVQIPANPRRSNIIRMARAVKWEISEALELAGESPASPAESSRPATDSRAELYELVERLPECRVTLLLHVAQAIQYAQGVPQGEGVPLATWEVEPGAAARRRNRKRANDPGD